MSHEEIQLMTAEGEGMIAKVACIVESYNTTIQRAEGEGFGLGNLAPKAPRTEAELSYQRTQEMLADGEGMIIREPSTPRVLGLEKPEVKQPALVLS